MRPISSLARHERQSVGCGMLVVRRSVLLTALAATSLACEREQRDFRPPPSTPPGGPVTQSALRPGVATGDVTIESPYEGNAFAVSEGKRLFSAWNCVGCHAHGGGGIGPALMDERWIYGSDPENIYATIVEGRPNGMPAFGGRVPSAQVWQLVAYVRSLSGMVNADARAGRQDHMQVRIQDQALEGQRPRQSTRPPR